MSTLPPPLPTIRSGPPPLPPGASRSSRWWIMPAFVLALAGASAVAGAFVLPALRRPGPDDTPFESRAGEASLAVAAEKKSAPRGSPFDLPSVVPELPNSDGPYALARLIDSEIDRALASAGVTASPLAGDAEFLRRVHLDLVGHIPSAERTRAFLDDSDPLKRSKVVDELLASSAHGLYLARLWADLLVKRDPDNTKNLKTGPFVEWMAGRLNNGAGWDQIAREMITAEGAEASSPATFFIMANQDNRQPSPPKLAGAVGNLFMGVQIQCAECHRHPYIEEWSQDDFWGLAAFFSHTRADRGGGGKGKNRRGLGTIREAEGKPAGSRMKAPPTGLRINVPDPNDPRKVVRVAAGRFFKDSAPVPGGKGPHRPVLASWLTADANPYFAPAAVNRFWSHLFARGLANPIEEMTSLDKASHPALLRSLASTFRQNKYDLKFLFRAICNSQAYQRTSRPTDGNETDETLLSHMPVKVMDAWQLVDSLGVATGARARLASPRGGRRPAAGVGSGGDALVRTLDTREPGDDPTDFGYGIPQLLKLMNTSLTAASSQAAARLARTTGQDHARGVEEIYLATLGRRPRPEETERLVTFVQARGAEKGYAGVYWALLNCAEFVSNH